VRDFVSAAGNFSFLLIKCHTEHPCAREGKINGVVARSSNSLFVILVFIRLPGFDNGIIKRAEIASEKSGNENENNMAKALYEYCEAAKIFSSKN